MIAFGYRDMREFDFQNDLLNEVPINRQFTLAGVFVLKS